MLKKKYVCDHPSCGRLFRLQKQLLRHAKHHTGDVQAPIIHVHIVYVHIALYIMFGNTDSISELLEILSCTFQAEIK